MRPAIVYKDDQIFIEFPPEVFLELLKTYTQADEELAKKLKDALDKIVIELKNKTQSV